MLLVEVSRGVLLISTNQALFRNSCRDLHIPPRSIDIHNKACYHTCLFRAIGDDRVTMNGCELECWGIEGK